MLNPFNQVILNILITIVAIRKFRIGTLYGYITKRINTYISNDIAEYINPHITDYIVEYTNTYITNHIIEYITNLSTTQT